MKCDKCGREHPTEDEWGEYPGSAAPVGFCPTIEQLIELADHKVKARRLACDRAEDAWLAAISEKNDLIRKFAKTLTA